MDGRLRSDKGQRRLVSARDPIRLRHQQDPERGQATTEFALILFPLLLLVTGIIYFGIALNYWLDMQKIANQGARWAAVNNWPPDCPFGQTCTSGANTLPESLKRQALTNGLRSSVTVTVCFPDGGSHEIGDPVRVRLSSPFTFVPILGIGTITLGANATMRLEQMPTNLSPYYANTC